uniref:NAD(P)/FAD-dependent oxidoreductase n=1 Tax=Candidatus Ventrimonas sp. TaxID=3048889 RepID=UPI003FF0B6B3
MIRVNQLKLPVEHKQEDLKKKAARALRITSEQIERLEIRRRSLDGRKKPELFYSYTVDIKTAREEQVLHRAKNSQAAICREKPYTFPKPGEEKLFSPPVIAGAGPAGLFAGLMLARAGYRPVILERGEDVDSRRKRVDEFWKTGNLDVRSNVQFGEGGAGTFSDGKLNTLVKDPLMRNRLVLEIFCEFGADPSILYDSKPHIGTDVLSGIVKAMRQEIVRLGGQVRFCCQVTDLVTEGGQICGVKVRQQERKPDENTEENEDDKLQEKEEFLPAQAVILAVGHSARDTFSMLEEKKIPMDAKSFAVGLRIQHPQPLINLSQYGREKAGSLGAASYKLTRQTSTGRGVYSFCMCPGGYVVDASSEKGHLAVNGMSYHARDGKNANSALIVTVTPEDFPEAGPLGGVAFQRSLEKLAYQAADGRIPVQLYEDYRAGRMSRQLGEIEPQMRGRWAFGNLREVMPEKLNLALLEAMEGFGQMIRGFDRPDALFAGIESRTSSPVRIWRNEEMESKVRGLYPCGEGAGYAGGITSAAMDGVKVAEAIVRRFGLPQ